MSLLTSVKNEVSKKLEEYEGKYNHLYLDSLGKVTVGIGHLIINRTAIASVTMYTVKNKLPANIATLSEKQAEFDTIAKQKKNYKASWYKQHTNLMMKDIDINAQRNKHISTFYKELASYYKKTNGFKSGFDSFPTKAQTALFDMIFNLGFTTLKDKFTKFNDSIKKEDWAAAAKQSNRPQISSLRNGYVKGLFNGIPKTITTAKP